MSVAAGPAIKYFSVESSHDLLSAYIPKGTPVNPEVANWSQEDLQDYLKALGFVGDIRELDYRTLVTSAPKASRGFAKDFVILRGKAAEPTTLGKIEWVNPPNLPRDQLVAEQAFLKVTETKLGQPGLSVKGTPVGGTASKEKVRPMISKMAKEFVRSEDGYIHSIAPGQAVMKGSELTFSAVYEIDSVNSKELMKAEFFSSVRVKADLPAAVSWKVHGDIHVDGHWSAGNVEVDGNASSESGIQTNLQGVLKIGGSLKTSYIQRSVIEIQGNLSIDSAILLSEITCRGDLDCTGSPGAIMGSTLRCYGALRANKVGSDRSVNTQIRIYRNPTGKKSTIGILSQGTKMHVFENKFIQQADMAYESPDQSSGL